MSKKKEKKSTKQQIAVGQFTDTSKLVFRAAPKRASKYDSIYDALRKLTKGKSFIIPLEKGKDPELMQNTVNAAIRRGPVKPPAGCVFRKNTTVDGNIAVCCLAEKEAGSIYRKEQRADFKKAEAKK